jgi:two-component system OmpR family response regulator
MPRRLLIIEGETMLRDLLRDIFADEGYAVDTVADGAEGWAKLVAGKYDQVLSNVMLPYLDGRAVLRRARADPALRRIPFILMSANQSASAEADWVAAFVAKPFDLDELSAAIERVLDTAYP